jgi:hypothetical protein
MEIIVLPDGETYGALDGCSIRRVPDGASDEELDGLLARGGGEVIASLSDDRRRPRRSRQAERRAFAFPGRVWLADVRTEGPHAIEIFFSHEGVAARSLEDHAAYYSAAAVRPLREALERYANDPDVDAGLGLGARDALTRFRAMSGERRAAGSDG